MTVTAIITGGTRFLAAFLGGALLVGALGPVAAEAQNRTEHIFDDWRVVCQEEADPENNARCHMVQTLIQNETQREILRWMIVSDGENQAMHAVSAPLGVLLRPGIQLSSGDEDAASLS